MPANAPTSVATPLPPRKPCHTGKTWPRMAANAQAAGSHAASRADAGAMPGNASPGSSAAAIQPLAMSMTMTQIANAAPCVRSALVAPALPLPDLADVDAAAQAADHEAADNGAEKIGEQDLDAEIPWSAMRNFKGGKFPRAYIGRRRPRDVQSRRWAAASTASTDAYRRVYLRVASAWRAVSRHHQDA